ncbi:hypothetical protein DID88_008736 [Monilinia fructigena]|uniref:Sorting nexin-4 n=1 Tax=Monilinia fructigena TaxID=38457 RepID=A0A395J694_9HELO|nr:hypothetical protein DID88_008736 [Monilinia fructigena]
MDHDDFANIEWQNTQRGNSRSDDESDGPDIDRTGGENQAGPSADAIDLAGVGEGVLECLVGSPIKENDGTKDAFVSYLVTTHTTFPTFQKPTTTVRRRFTDFVFLYNTLCREYPACAVPPLPDKHKMEYAAGVFDNFTDTFINAFTKVHKPDQRFIEVKEKSDKLDEDLGHIEKIVARVARREGDLETDYKDLAEQFQRLINLEPGVEPSVHAFSASVEDTSAGIKTLKDHTDQNYLGSLRDMQAYSTAVKNLLKAREQKQLDFEQLTEYLNKSTHDRDQLASSHGSGALTGAGGFIRSKIEDVRGVDHEQSRRERLRRTEVRIEELTKEVEEAKKTTEAFDEEVVREVADFERIKRVEFRSQLGALADAHRDFYEGVASIWEGYVREMGGDEVVSVVEA